MNMNATKHNLITNSNKSQANIAPQPYIDKGLIETLNHVRGELMSRVYKININ
jgi:hypothetical protein